MNNLLISVSKLDNIQMCPQLFYLNDVLRLTPIESKVYFDTGDFMHWMLAEYYTSKMEGIVFDKEQFPDLARNWAAVNSPLSSADVETTITDFSMYLEYYQPIETFQVLGVEVPFAKILYEDSEFRLILNGKSDLIIKTQQGVKVIMDHKYESQFREKRGRANQPLGYCWAFEINDFMYNRIGKQKSYKPEQRLQRPYFNYASYQINAWINSAVQSAKDIVTYSKEGNWPERHTACTFHGNRCTFYEFCDSSTLMKAHRMKDLFQTREDHELMEKS